MVHTLDVQIEIVRILDGLRQRRNVTDYEGELVTRALLVECLAQALLIIAEQHLR